MNAQIAHSLAIQALFERKDNIQLHTPENTVAIRECDEAIIFMETSKEICSWIDGMNCEVSIKKVDPNRGKN